MEGWIYLANARYGWGGSKDEALDKAEAIAKKALALDSNDPDSYLLLAGVHRGRRELDQAVEYAQRAVELNPNHAGALITLGQILNYAGRPREALAAVRRGMRLSPHYPVIAPANLCLSHMMISEYGQAKARCEEVIERGALVLFMHARLAAICALAGDLEEARRYAAKVLELKPDFSVDAWSDVLFYKNQEDLDREIEGMRKAGLPL